ncbi:hypothetical protein A2V54_01405 [candidate division WWE3 bacterium RBG_19FT_COMBO_53_11]|uniref:Mur ligase central domain-containing protein n=1 Tax=candidate division WWE3 bacterium RBG_19FT_COMBO_53_11 TaxID=1802613 RepID=A0A1F4UIP1_UNCKA|nr:MAG: hypothetical protein A2V54_01405 [candidate division WWE3 bacterium RBG_19FT_COMBO_53_11]
MLKNPLRRLLRVILFFLARAALKKHRPTVVAIVGEGKTGIVREAIYSVLREHFPTRRNLEAPNAEFVLPLAVLGAREYPLTITGWLSILVKSLARLLLRPPYHHILVLEIEYTRKDVFDYFWNITEPEVLVICGETPFLSRGQTAQKIFRTKETPNLTGYLETALKVAQEFGIPKKEAQRNLQDFHLPKARIDILPAKDGGMIVDATYHYLPSSRVALEEVLEALPGRKIILSPQKEIPSNFKVHRGEIAVVTGPYRKMWTYLAKLSESPWT